MQRCKYHKGAEMNFLKMKSSTGLRLYKVDAHGCMRMDRDSKNAGNNKVDQEIC